MENTQKWTFEEFQEMLANRMGMPVERFHEGASFLDDLGIDSIRMTELMLEFDRLGLNIPPESVWDLQTVGDAYKFYQKNA